MDTVMFEIHRTIIKDHEGHPTEVRIPWEDFVKIEEVLGLDLDENTKKDLLQSKSDRDSKDYSSYTELNQL